MVAQNSLLTLKIILPTNFQFLFCGMNPKCSSVDGFLLFRNICYISVKCSMFSNSSSAPFWGFFATGMLQVPFLLAALKGTLNGECGYGDHWCSAGLRVPARIFFHKAWQREVEPADVDENFESRDLNCQMKCFDENSGQAMFGIWLTSGKGRFINMRCWWFLCVHLLN